MTRSGYPTVSKRDTVGLPTVSKVLERSEQPEATV